MPETELSDTSDKAVLFQAYVDLINSERETIWARHNALLVANSLIVGAIAISPTALWSHRWAALGLLGAGFLITIIWLLITILTQLDHLQPGQKVSISVDALPGRELQGKVVSVAPAGLGVLAAAARQRHRQFHQDRSARCGAHRSADECRRARSAAAGHVGRGQRRHEEDRRGDGCGHGDSERAVDAAPLRDGT